MFGVNDDHSEALAYVGQARERKNGTGVLGRIAEHIGTENHDYFTHALIIITSDDSFGATEISYLENAFYNQVRHAGRVRLAQNDPAISKVTEEKQAELDEFISYAKIAIGSLGFRLFDAVDEGKSSATASSSRSVENVEPLLYLEAMDAKGTGRQTADGFVVLAGSRLRPHGVQSMPKQAKTNREKYADRIDGDNVLTQDTLFTSPSAASDFLTGSSSSGKLYWKNEQGISLGELERMELQNLETP